MMPEGQKPWAGKEGRDLSYLRNQITRVEGTIGYRGGVTGVVNEAPLGAIHSCQL